MPRATLVISLPLAAALGGCSPTSSFTCAEDQACAGAGPEAQCEANGWCSVADDACADGRRYADHAGDGLGGVCLGEEGGTQGTSASAGTSVGSPTTTPDPSLDDTRGTDASESASADTGPPVLEPWWDCGWVARRELTLEVPDVGESLVDVPVLVVLDASRIDPSIMAVDGHDLRFVAEDDASVLSHELEQWAPEGLSWAWVRVPELHPGTNRLLMYYGNPAASPSNGGAEVWSGYTGVWHMGFEFADATGTNEPGLGMATGAAGQAGPAQRFVSGDGIAVTPSPSIDGLFAQGGTLTAMIRASSWGDNEEGLVVGRSDTPTGDGGWVLTVDGTSALRFARGFTTNRRTWFTPDLSLGLHAWHHVAVVYQDDPFGDPTFYLDGVPQRAEAQGMGNGRPEPDDAPLLLLGGEPFAPGQAFDGILDEVRMAPVLRSAAWMAVEVASLRDELASYGAPQSSPCD